MFPAGKRSQLPKRELSGYRRAKNFINTSVRMCPTDKNFPRRVKIMSFMVLFQVLVESVSSLWLFGIYILGHVVT